MQQWITESSKENASKRKEKKISPTFLDQVNLQLDIIRVPCTWPSWHSAYFVVIYLQEFFSGGCSFPLINSGLLTAHPPPWGRKQQPTTVFLPWKFHGQRSLVGYSPRGLKELDTTEWLSNNEGSFTQLHSISTCNHGQPPPSAHPRAWFSAFIRAESATDPLNVGSVEVFT